MRPPEAGGEDGELLLELRGIRRGRLLSRASRFTVEVVDEGGAVRLCHLHDPGRLRHLLRRGAGVLYREAWRPGRRTGCDVVAVEAPSGVLVLEDTRLPNRLWPRASALLLPGANGWVSERWVNGTRVDFVSSLPDGRPLLVEVKGTNLVESGVALFPDAPSARAVRQLEALLAASRSGAAAYLVFTVLRPDAARLRPHWRVDPRLASRLCQAWRSGVGVLGYRVRAVERNGVLEVYYAGRVPVEACLGRREG